MLLIPTVEGYGANFGDMDPEVAMDPGALEASAHQLPGTAQAEEAAQHPGRAARRVDTSTHTWACASWGTILHRR